MFEKLIKYPVATTTIGVVGLFLFWFVLTTSGGSGSPFVLALGCLLFAGGYGYGEKRATAVAVAKDGVHRKMKTIHVVRFPDDSIRLDFTTHDGGSIRATLGRQDAVAVNSAMSKLIADIDRSAA